MCLNWPVSRRIVSGLLSLLFTIGIVQAAAASDSLPVQSAPISSEPLAAVSDVRLVRAEDQIADPAAAGISFSRAASGEGRIMYARRDANAGSAAVVTFSTTRPRLIARSVTVGGTTASGGPLAARSSGPVGPLPRFLPVSARLMTSGFGSRYHPILGVQRNHLGVDLAVPSGTPIAATADGVVSFAAWDGGYGLLVAVDHGGGIQTRYAHMSRIAVSSGQRVHTGDVLGYVGTTGLSTGPHVHYEVRVNGQAVSPFSR